MSAIDQFYEEWIGSLVNHTFTSTEKLDQFYENTSKTTLDKFKPLVGMFKEVGELSYEEWIDSLVNHTFTSTEILELFTKLVESELMYTTGNNLATTCDFKLLKE